jgi:hypothetical protein
MVLNDTERAMASLLGMRAISKTGCLSGSQPEVAERS